MDDLRFIRKTMERAGAFTAIPGWGGVAIGIVALPAAYIASRQPTEARWLATWLITAAVAAAIAAGTMSLKAKRARIPLSTGPGRKFFASFFPPVAAAIALTAALFAHGAWTLLPGLWMLSYGAAIITAGSFSVKIVPIMGIAFMIAGVAALATPPEWIDAWMAAGFGALHIIFGFLIARSHGG